MGCCGGKDEEKKGGEKPKPAPKPKPKRTGGFDGEAKDRVEAVQKAVKDLQDAAKQRLADLRAIPKKLPENFKGQIEELKSAPPDKLAEKLKGLLEAEIADHLETLGLPKEIADVMEMKELADKPKSEKFVMGCINLVGGEGVQKALKDLIDVFADATTLTKEAAKPMYKETIFSYVDAFVDEMILLLTDLLDQAIAPLMELVTPILDKCKPEILKAVTEMKDKAPIGGDKIDPAKVVEKVIDDFKEHVTGAPEAIKEELLALVTDTVEAIEDSLTTATFEPWWEGAASGKDEINKDEVPKTLMSLSPETLKKIGAKVTAEHFADAAKDIVGAIKELPGKIVDAAIPDPKALTDNALKEVKAQLKKAAPF